MDAIPTTCKKIVSAFYSVTLPCFEGIEEVSIQIEYESVSYFEVTCGEKDKQF